MHLILIFYLVFKGISMVSDGAGKGIVDWLLSKSIQDAPSIHLPGVFSFLQKPNKIS